MTDYITTSYFIYLFNNISTSNLKWKLRVNTWKIKYIINKYLSGYWALVYKHSLVILNFSYFNYRGLLQEWLIYVLRSLLSNSIACDSTIFFLCDGNLHRHQEVPKTYQLKPPFPQCQSANDFNLCWIKRVWGRGGKATFEIALEETTSLQRC